MPLAECSVQVHADRLRKGLKWTLDQFPWHETGEGKVCRWGEKRFKGRFSQAGVKLRLQDGTAAMLRNEKSSAPALPHVIAMKNRRHDFKSRAVAERNRRRVFLQQGLTMKTQVFDFILRDHDKRNQAAAIKKRGIAIKNPYPARKHPPVDFLPLPGVCGNCSHDPGWRKWCMGCTLHYCRIQHHYTIRNFSEQTFVVIGADGDKIRPGLRIIVITQADGMAMMNIGIVFHHKFAGCDWFRVAITVGAKNFSPLQWANSVFRRDNS